MNNINQDLQHQIDVMRSQKHIELGGPVDEVQNYIQALSRIYELADEVAAQTKKLDDIKEMALSCTNDREKDYLIMAMGIICGICDR